MKHILLFCISFIIISVSYAAPGELPTLEHADGVWRIYLDSSIVNDLATDDAGYVWCATSGGLVRWNPDGSYVKYTTLDGLPHNIVDAVMVDASGAVWVGCSRWGGGSEIACFKAGRWQKYTDIIGVISPTRGGLASDGRGTLWVNDGSNVYSFDGTNLRSWRPGADLQDAIAVDGSGKVWVGAKEGAMCFDGEAWKTYTKADGLADDSVRSIAVDRDGVLWFGTQSGISSYDGSVWRTWSVNSYTDPAYQCPRCLENPVPDIAVDRNNVKWFGTCYGLARFDGASWTTWTPEGGGLLDKKIVNIVVDAANRLWIAYDGFAVGGPRMITRFDGVEWRHFSMDGPSWNEVLRVGVDRGGVKWFYCGWSGMSVFDGASWRTVVPTGAPGDFRLFDFTVSADVVRWFATQKGLWRFDGEEWRAFTAENSGLASNYVSAVAVDGSGVLWCGTGSGVSSFDGALWKTYREPGSPGQEPVNCVLTDRVGAKWFGTDKGVFRFDGASWMSFGEEPLIGSVRVLSAAVDSRNVKWFATLAGLVRFDGERWTRFTKENSGLTADYAFKVVVDRADVLWIVPGYPKALVRYDGVSWDSWEFYELPFQGGVNDIAVDERNVKWFATTWGISSFDDGPSDGPTVVNEPSALPAAVRVLGNSPNPFNSSTVIRFALPRAVRAELAVFDVTGRKVRTLVSGQLPAGTSEARWDGRDDSGRAVSSGIYLSRLAVGGKAETRKMMLIR